MFSVSKVKLAIGAVCLMSASYALLSHSAKDPPVENLGLNVQQTSNNNANFMPVTFMHSATFFGLLVLAIALIPFASNSRFGKTFVSVGNSKRPVRCPQYGHVIKVDNRPFMGAIAIVMSFIQLSIVHYMVINSNQDARQFSFALLYLDFSILAMLVIFYARFIFSNPFLYYGLFPWTTSVIAASQACVCLYATYMSFFTPENVTVPMIGKDASIYSNCLIGTTVIGIMQMFLLQLIQLRLYFTRPIDEINAKAEPVSKYLPHCYSDSTNQLTPLAPPHSVDPADLVDIIENNVSWLNRAIFSWNSDILERGVKKPLESTDLYKLHSSDSSEYVLKKYKKHGKEGHSLLYRLVSFFAVNITYQVVSSTIAIILQFVKPYLLQRIIHAISVYKDESIKNEYVVLRRVYLDAFGLLFASGIEPVLINYAINIGRHSIAQLNIILVNELTVKTINRPLAQASGLLSANNNNETLSSSASSGRIMNVLTTDFNKAIHAIGYLHHLFIYPVAILFGGWYIYRLLGISVLIGLLISYIFGAITKSYVFDLGKAEANVASLGDDRVGVIKDIIQGIKTIKLAGWESRFLDQVDEQRYRQLAELWKKMNIMVWVKAFSALSPVVAFTSILFVYIVILGNSLTAELAFTSISVFYLVRTSIERYPREIGFVIGSYIAFKRIDEYLQQPEIQSTADRVAANRVDSDCRIGFINADMHWDKKQDNSNNYADQPDEDTSLLSSQSDSSTISTTSFSLKGINVQFPTGGLSLIAGPTGSGKTSLLSALIGEMTLTQGQIIVPTTRNNNHKSEFGCEISDIAYVPQEAWLRNATIRENILFGEPYDQQRYEEVIWVCALRPDLNILTDGDLTEIGECGVTLSGGQKQRVALARAVYSRNSILLIDDCLSAVDTHTANHILTKCLIGNSSLMENRTCVLVTHHISLCIPHAQYIVMISEGQVVLQGIPSELQAKGALTEVFSHLKTKLDVNDDNTLSTEAGDLNNDNNVYDASKVSTSQTQLVKDEEREQGTIKQGVWTMYLSACGGWYYWMAVLLLLATLQMINVFQDYWVRIWVAATGKDDYSHSTSFWVGVYTIIGILGSLWQIILWKFIYSGSLDASTSLHANLIRAVVHATPKFFNSTPLGRIINRFSQDIQVIDEVSIETFMTWLLDIFAVIGIFTAISMVIPAFCIIAVILMVIYYILASYYLCSTRELMRLSSINRAPLVSHLGELILGTSSIRAFGVSELYLKESLDRIELYNRASHMTWTVNRWLEVRIDNVNAFVSFLTAVIVLMNIDRFDAGLAGFVISYSISFTQRVIWVVRNYAIIETNMNSVERISQYINSEQEAALHSLPGNEPPRNWPSSGKTEIKDLIVEYVPGEPVLHGISLTAKHGEKIGVVGRTGAGKSTLSLALLRFIEAASGSIILDGVDISKIGLEELRHNVTIIPQDPVLFNGTIRFNIDPFNEFPDELIWDSLKRTYLVLESTTDASSSSESDISRPIEKMVGIFNSLDAEIKENGQNLSLGQRQLVALARALVRRSHLIVMDEATASVDFDTDSHIQSTIRGSEFANSTLFCVAHRLRTIIDYDRILVLDKGMVVELDTPANLLQRSGGIFKSMCEQSGEYEELVRLAHSRVE